MALRTLGLLVIVALAGCFAPDAPPETASEPAPPDSNATQEFDLVPVAEGLSQPTFITHDSFGRLVVTEKTGTIQMLDDNGTHQIYDFSPVIESSGSEQGLLGLAFAPAGDTAFVAYTDMSGATALASFPVVPGADTAEATVLLAVDQPFSNHNGGMVAFGPDGHLYFGLGDGGLAGDPGINGQNPQTLLGTILRIDVSGGTAAAPSDNPFVGDPLGHDLVWAYGLRNPWRFSFDRETGDLWIADVGQDAVEEIDFLPSGHPGGANFGWNPYEGTLLYPAGLEAPLLQDMFTFPAAQYGHDLGCSVTGGYAVRDPTLPSLAGHYVFGDFCSGTIWHMAGPEAPMETLLESGLMISSFGEGADGGIYVADFGGHVYRLASS